MDIISSNDSDIPLPARPVLLLLLDGLGVASASEVNAVSQTKKKFIDKLIKEYPVATLDPGNKTLNARYLSLGSGRDEEDENKEQIRTITRIISESGLKQLKIMEAERLAALTHFFNGHEENKLSGEEWITVSSEIKNVVKPSLLLKRTLKEISRAVSDGNYNFIAVSLPVLDLAAQSGNFEEATNALSEIDSALKKIVSLILNKHGVLILSSAHGNIEKMKDFATDLIDKGMTDNPVPLIIIGRELEGKTIGLDEPANNDLSLLTPAGTLADIAPTILKIMNLDKPVEMTGVSLI